MELCPYLFCLFWNRLCFFLPPFEDNRLLFGCMMSSASIQKLFCGIYSAFKCSFDEFVGEKVVSSSYSSAIFFFFSCFKVHFSILLFHCWFCSVSKSSPGVVLRWWRNRTGRPLSPQQIHQTNISMLSKSHKTTSECRQRTSGTQKSSPLSSKRGRKKI